VRGEGFRVRGLGCRVRGEGFKVYHAVHVVLGILRHVVVYHHVLRVKGLGLRV
jgi:hypothetical protein